MTPPVPPVNLLTSLGLDSLGGVAGPAQSGVVGTVPGGIGGQNPSFAIQGVNIPQFQEVQPIPLQPAPAASSQIVEPTTWTHLAHQLIDQVNQSQNVANTKIQDILAGGPTPVHEAVIAMEEASLSFQLLAEVRNKLVDSFQEVMRMQV